MSRPRSLPKYSLHKASGNARVKVRGREIWLGRFNSPESLARYRELLGNLETAILSDAPSSMTLTELLGMWWAECQQRYPNGRGKFGSATNWRRTIRWLRESFGEVRVEQLSQCAVSHSLSDLAVSSKWSKTYVAMTISRIKLIANWAYAEELITHDVCERLLAVQSREGLLTGPRPPVSLSVVEATLLHLPPLIAVFVRVQLLSGCRPGELVGLTRDDVDMTGEVWVARLDEHKNAHRMQERTLYFGPEAQRLLSPLVMKADPWIFPNRAGTGPIDVDCVGRAIRSRCDKHKIPRWSPANLRKTAAGEIRDKYDIETASALLGHSSVKVTEDYYARFKEAKAIRAMTEVG